MKRREFLRSAGLLAGAGLLPGSGLFSDLLAASRKTGHLPHFGIITGNTGGKWLENDPRKALEKIAALGYRYLEFGGTFGMERYELKSFLGELGLNPLVGSTGMQALTRPEELEKDIHACLAMGNKYIVCYWPWTDDGRNKTADDWKKVADNLNKGGERCKREGLELLYHNHDLEFRPLGGGEMPFDVLMNELDPEYTNIELDLYWIAKGDRSAVEYIRKYPGRYPVYHLKDMDNTPQRDFEYVGKGIIDFPSIFDLHSVAGAKYFIVEHAKPADPELCVRTAAEYLSRLTF
jgi:sugar phosphate isomerase/epimerase